MFTPLLLSSVLTVLAADVGTCDHTQVRCAGAPQVKVLRSCCDDGANMTVRLVALGAGEEPGEKRVVVVKAGDEKAAGSDVWIGVRLTPVPAPLAAHIGEGGVMIANIVKDSPADKAGLQQYDVVLSFNGQKVAEPGDLVEAVSKAPVGESCKLGLVRKGKAEDVKISPAKRPTSGDMSLKYAEPEESLVDDAVKLRGLTLKHGPDGRWMMRDLGPLHGLPDALKDLETKFNIEISPNLPDLPDIEVFTDDDEDEGPGDAERKIEVRVKVDEDGECTTIVQESDGKIQVTRKGEAGKESSATYDSPEEFRKADPESYKFYRRHGDSRPSALFHWFGDPAHAEARKEFQIEIERKVRDALERAKEAGVQADEKARDAYQKARERVKERVELREKREAAGDESIMVRANDDGSLTVVVAQAGNKVTHEYKSKEAFKAAEPELYGRVKGLLE